MAKQFNALPYEGGLLEQPPGALFRMDAVMRASEQPEVAKVNRETAEQKVKEQISGVRR